ncbi:hypothetical protein BDW59DRAFT_172999 [Aspergillus cavernicola]|uniref:SRR1-like domain-containing protein n=1 Tax=Aspergillus cavernicola TaxID=176166 RepID=A0ABR4I964_9EURO
MPITTQQPPIRVELLDEWKGILDPKTRRTLQNRLNQRAHRKTLARKAGPKPANNAVTKHTTSPKIEFTGLDTLSILGPTAESSRHLIQHLESLLHAEFSAGSPRTDLLLGLTRLNILRALHANIEVLGFSAAAMHDDAESPFATSSNIESTRPLTDLPLALQPTTTQLAIVHHPWLDLLPIPKMRDNLIQAGDSINDAQLCHDMCGNQPPLNPKSRARSANGETGIIVWKDPWDPSGWEVTETFLRLWGWAVKDCSELFRSTNRWRAVRGEPPLFCLPEE